MSRRRGPLRGLWISLQFLTRLPVSPRLDPRPGELGRAIAWFPAVGAIVGAIAGVAGWLALGLGLPASAAAVVAILAGIVVTGGFHEDGLADSADGLGGGWDRARVLEIMRDSRIGSYGAIALVSLIAARLALLLALPPAGWAAGLIAAHALSRWTAAPVILALPYARADDPRGIAKPLVEGVGLGRGLACGLVAWGIAWLATGPDATACWLASALVAAGGARIFQRRIAGITGDGLGAINVVAELAVLAVLAVRWSGSA